MRTDIDDSRKKGVRKNGIGIRIIGIACSLFNAGNGVLSCRRLKVALSVMVTIETIGQIRDFSLIIGVCLLMGRSGVEHQYVIGWGQA